MKERERKRATKRERERERERVGARCRISIFGHNKPISSFHFFEKVSRFRFQRALNHSQRLSLSQVMQENVILAYYAQIWKFVPRLPNMEFFKKNFHFSEKVFKFRSYRALNHLQIQSLTQVMQENILSKKLNLGLNFSTPNGGVSSPSLKGSMVHSLGPHPLYFYVVITIMQKLNSF